MNQEKIRIVVIGGGTGSHTVLRGLKKYAHAFDITAIVTMADSGGSTGRLRDEFGYLPVGDARMALTALSNDDDEYGELVRQLFMYRFEKGEGLRGHNFGNLFLTALSDIIQNEVEAIKVATRLLGCCGRVLPVTTDNVHLMAEYDNQTTVCSEATIDDPPPHSSERRITRLFIEPVGVVYEDAREAIASADVIVVGPGDLYSSVLANIVVHGMKEALQNTSAHIFFIANLMTRPGQTRGMTLKEHVEEFARYSGRMPDVLIQNSEPLPEEILALYINDGDSPIVDDSDSLSIPIITADILAEGEVMKHSADTVKRSLLRHDSEKLAAVIFKRCSEIFPHIA